MPIPGESLYDRGRLASGAMLQADWDAFVRSLTGPKSLAPGQIKTVADRFGFDPDDVVGAAINTLTDPLVVIGAILGMRYPIKGMKESLRWIKNLKGKEVRDVTGYAKKTGWVAKQLGSIHAALAGTQTARYWDDLIGNTDWFKRTFSRKFRDAVESFTVKSGIDLSKRKDLEILMAAKAARLDTPNNRFGVQLYDTIDLAAIHPELETLHQAKQGIYREIRDLMFERRINPKTKLPEVRLKNDPSARWETEHELYFPERMAPGPETLESFKKTMEAQRRGQQKLSGSLDPRAWSKHLSRMSRREARMGPNIEELALTQEYLLPDAADKVAKMYRKNPKLKPMSMRSLDVAEQYVANAGNQYGWFTTGAQKGNKFIPHGELIERDLETFSRQGRRVKYKTKSGKIKYRYERYEPGTTMAATRFVDPVKAKLLKDVWLPILYGGKTAPQIERSIRWAEGVYRAVGELEKPEVRKLISPKMADKIKGWIMSDRGHLQPDQIWGKLAGYFYLSALGGNPASGAWNLIGGALTGSMTIGPKAWLAGAKSAFSGADKYFRARVQGKNAADALAKAFPHFGEAGLAGSPIREEILGTALEEAWKLGGVGEGSSRFKRGLDVTKRALMSLFSHTERFNRISTFEGARIRAMQEGSDLAEAISLGRSAVNRAQIVGGPGLTPSAFAGMNPLFKQFLRFPVGMAELASGAPFPRGGGSGFADRVFGKLGYFGRALMYGGLAKGVFENVLPAMGFDPGVDVERGLLFSALPLNTVSPGDSPAGLIPLPPILSLLGQPVMDAVRGDDWSASRRNLQLLIPGGVGLTRAATTLGGMISPRASQAASWLSGRAYVDYERTDENGRHAMYQHPKGSSEPTLVGYFTPWEITKQALGLGPQEVAQERELISYMAAQTQRIRAYRRQYLDSMVTGEYGKMRAIEQEFNAAYPEMKGLHIRPKDVRAVQMRREVPRLERQLAEVPEEMRAPLAEAIQLAMVNSGSNFLGIDPGLLQSGTPKQRMGSRPRSPLSYGQNLQSAAGPPGRPAQPGSGTAAAVGRPHVQGFAAFTPF